MDFTAFNQRRTSHLSFAARTGDLNALKKLLKKRNCDVNYNDSRGWTALHEAAAHDQYEAAKLILAHKSCRPTVKSHDGKTVLFVALLGKSSMRTIELLLNIENIANLGTNEDVTPLHLVAQQGKLEAGVALIRAGADINKADFDGDTPLHEAAHAGHSDIVSLLLHCGCNPEPRNDQQYTPLHFACMLPTCESAKYILMFSTDVNCSSSNDDTPLSLAAMKSSLQTVRLLFENGASPHLRGSAGRVPLYHAMENDASVFKLMLEKTNHSEINFNIIREASDPALFDRGVFEAVLKSNLEPEFFYSAHDCVLNLLHTKGMLEPPIANFLRIADYLFTTNADSFESLFMLFLMRGIPVNAMQENEMPPLSCLHLYPNKHCGSEVLRILVEHGANVDYFCPDDNQFPNVFSLCLLYCRSYIPNIFQYSLVVDPSQVAEEELKMHGSIPDTLHFALVRNLKNACRLVIRQQLRTSGNIKTTQEFLTQLYTLPLPKVLCDYIRFIEH